MFSKQGELDLARVLKALIDAGDIEPRPGFRGGQLVDHGPSGVRQGYFEAGLVRKGEHANEWVVREFYRNKYKNPDGSTEVNAYFKSEDEALDAIEKRKIQSGRGLTLEELNKKYKTLLKEHGLKSWDKATDAQKKSMKNKMAYKYVPTIPEGLASKVDKETRRLLALKKPINPATGLPYSLREFSEIKNANLRHRIISEMKGKPRRHVEWGKREGWYPEKNDNRLLTYMEKAAKQQKALKIPLKNRTFINVYEMDGKTRKFVGVKDVKSNVLYTHVDYDLSKSGAKKGISIAAQKNGKFVHPDMERFLTYFKVQEKFKYQRPTALLQSYFSEYSKVPTYNEIYNFFTMHAGTKPHLYTKFNALTLHHQDLVRNKPTKMFQLLIRHANIDADKILTKFDKGKISKADAIRQLKEIGARVEGMGIKASDITPKKGLAIAKKEAVKKFTEAIKKNPAIVDEMAKALNLAKTAKGPAKVKAVASIVALVGGYTADKLLKEHGISLTQDENEKVLEAGMLPTELIKEHPVTSTLGAAATLRGSKSLKGDPLKMVRKAVHTPVTFPLKKLIRSLGTPLAGAGFAGWQIYDNLKAGESIADAVVDPIVGAELAFPSLFKQNISKIIPDKYQNVAAKAGRKVLGLGKVGSRFMGPVGVAVGAAGSVYDAYKDYQRRKPYIEKVKELRKQGVIQEEQFDENLPMFKSGGLANLTRTVAPDSGPMSRGLSYLYNRVKKQ
tara:strand:+ start:45 stop:2234 length:2190 start_codon:yes stop_codon:yes gene_type:complete